MTVTGMLNKPSPHGCPQQQATYPLHAGA
jgi:hypothetical protein